jgi:RimJ/RimL family protein N-acetyltransferase
MQVRALQPDDAPALIVLRREALTNDPLAFGASVDDDRGLSLDQMRASLASPTTSAVFGAFDGGALVGMVGLTRVDRVKMRHRAMVWGMYVTLAARGKGVGAALLRAAVDHARDWPGVLQVHLAVTDTAVHAQRMYLRAGFREWGLEPRALQWEGRHVDEHHMVLDLT